MKPSCRPTPPRTSLALLHLLGFLALTGFQSSAAELLLLHGATVHPVTAPVLTNASVFIRDGRIAAVGTEIKEPGARSIDLHGLHLYPGLIAPSTVLGLIEVDAIRATRDTTEVGEFTPDVYAWMAVNPDSELIPVARANGFTHAQAIPLGGVVSGWSAAIALDGWTIEDMARMRTAGLHVFWPEFTLDTTPRERSPSRDKWKSIEDQVKERDRKLKALDDFFHDAEAYAHARDVAPTNGFRRIPAWESMLPAVRRERPLFIHADEHRQIRSAIEWAARRKYRMVLAGGRDAWRSADMLATNQVTVIYEDVFTPPPRDVDPYDVQFAAPAILARAGVHVAFSEGSDRFSASNVRNAPYAAAQAVAFGLPREEALRGLTLYPAQVLGLGDRLGSIEVGREASMFAATGDILDIRSRVERMWIGGREVSVQSRHTRLYEKYRQRPRPAGP